MIAIDNTLVSDELIEEHFICDLNRCKGACCVQGELGAPLEKEELKELKKVYAEVKPYMTSKGIKTVEKQGLYIIDVDNDYTTPLVGPEKECAYTYFENGTAKCAIEKAHDEGKISFKKPISCHLYPVRVDQMKGYTAVNYHRWSVCAPACDLGKSQKVKVYEFLKVPLIRKFGESWYRKLSEIAQTIAD